MFIFRLEKLREVKVPTRTNSASLHPDRTIFVCGGEDLKMYKFDYATGNEIGKHYLHLIFKQETPFFYVNICT